MKNLNLNFHYDAGHGWLEVPTQIVKKVGILKKISRYSYLDSYSASDRKCYLEEDCDAPLFLEACKSKGIKVTIDYIDDDISSPIRNLPKFEPNLYV